MFIEVPPSIIEGGRPTSEKSNMKLQQGSTYVRELDGLRGVSVLLVIYFHAFLCGFGWIGVQIFFVLSGYLIGGILLNLKSNSLSVWENLKTFEFRRILRIFPVYYLYLFLVIGVAILRSHPVTNTIGYLLSYTGNYVGTFNGFDFDLQTLHLWSLSVEEQFYCFFPLCILLLNKKWIKPFLLSLVVISPLFRWLYAEHLIGQGKTGFDVGVPVYWHTVSQLDAFCYGMLIHEFSLQKLPARVSAAILAALLLIAMLANYAYGHVLSSIRYYEHIWHCLLLDVLSMFLIIVILSKKYLQYLFSRNWLVEIGKISYGMYVFHFIFLIPYLKLADKYKWGWATRFAACTGMTILLFVFCKLLFTYYESVFLKLKPDYKARLSPS